MDLNVTDKLAEAEKLLQQSKGSFNFDNLFCEDTSSDGKLANYVGPIKIVNMSGKICSMIGEIQNPRLAIVHTMRQSLHQQS